MLCGTGGGTVLPGEAGSLLEEPSHLPLARYLGPPTGWTCSPLELITPCGTAGGTAPPAGGWKVAWRSPHVPAKGGGLGTKSRLDVFALGTDHAPSGTVGGTAPPGEAGNRWAVPATLHPRSSLGTRAGSTFSSSGRIAPCGTDGGMAPLRGWLGVAWRSAGITAQSGCMVSKSARHFRRRDG